MSRKKLVTLSLILASMFGTAQVFAQTLEISDKPSAGIVPDEFIKAAIIKDDGKSLEALQWKAADAILNGIVAGYNAEMGFGVNIYVNNLITGNQETYQTNVNADGTFQFSVPMTVTQQVLFRVVYDNGNRVRFNENILLSPDEETRICIDMHAFLQKEVQPQNVQQTATKIFYFAGVNAEINNQYFDADYSKYLGRFRSIYNDNSIAGMTAQEYKDYVINIKNGCLQDIVNDNPALTTKTKDFFRLNLEYLAAYYLYWASENMESAYRRQHNITDRNVESGFVQPVLDEEYYSYLKDLPLNDPISLYFSDYKSVVNGCRFLKIDADGLQQQLWISLTMQRLMDSNKIDSDDLELAKQLQNINPDSLQQFMQNNQSFVEKYNQVIGNESMAVNNILRRKSLTDVLEVSEGMLFDLIQCQEISRNFEEMTPLTEVDFEQLKQISDPFYAEYLTAQNDILLARIEANKSQQGYTANDVSGMEGEELYEAIAGKEKGKVVLVDFWATWCGPCRIANQHFAPHKSKFDADNVVFVYLTDESSPIEAWNNMIPELSGEHYRLTKSQYDYIKQRFEVDVRGVPSYLIFDKNGVKAFFQTGFPGIGIISDKINEALAK